MPVDPNTPEPLKTALEEMERSVQQFKTSLSYQAPEQHRTLWIMLQQELATTLATLWADMSVPDLVAYLRDIGPASDPDEWHRLMAKYDPEHYAQSETGRAYRALKEGK